MKASPNAAHPLPARAPFKRRGSILLSLVAVLVVVGLLPLSTAAWKLIDINREALKTSTQEYQLQVASSTARQWDVHMESLSSQLLRLSRTFSAVVGRAGSFQRAEVRRVLDGLADDRIICIRYADLRGESATSSDAAATGPELTRLLEEGFRSAAESLVERSHGPTSVVTESGLAYLPESPPRPVLVLSAPVFQRGSFRGVLSAAVDLRSVWNGVRGETQTGHAVFTLDPSNRVIASTDPIELPQGADVSTSGLVIRFRRAEGRAFETLPFEWNSEPFLGSYSVTRNGWGVLVQAREQQVYSPVDAMVRSTRLWALMALSLALVAAMVLTGTLSKPIHDLAAASRAFASGDFSTRVRVRTRNEIGELADTFNRMASEIEDYIRRLKQAARENRELFLGTIRALTEAIDAKDPYTRGHSARVNAYAVTIGRYMGLSPVQIRELDVAARLHDVGKIAIDDAVLRKPGSLTPEEFEHMKTHPVRGATIMAPIPHMRNVIPGLRSHHERWAGGGYPDGLSGENIPLVARIISVADTFDATTTERPYQRSMTFEQAAARINELRGVVLDECVVDAFNRAWEAGEFRKEAVSASVPETAGVLSK